MGIPVEKPNNSAKICSTVDPLSKAVQWHLLRAVKRAPGRSERQHRGRQGRREGRVPVRGDPRVILVQRSLRACGNRLLAIIQMAEASNIPGLVLRVVGDLHAAHGVHLLEEGQQLFAVRCDCGRWRFEVFICTLHRLELFWAFRNDGKGRN